jgi:hypothetical protein
MRSGPRAHEKKPSTKGVDGRGHVLHPITEQEVLAGARAALAKRKKKKTEKKNQTLETTSSSRRRVANPF